MLRSAEGAARTTTRRTVPVVLSVVFSLLPAACSGSDEPPTGSRESSNAPAPTSTTSSAPSPTATEVPLPTTTPEAAKIALAVLGDEAAADATEQAVVDSWMTYWRAVVQTYGELEPAADLAVAQGKPVSDVLAYLGELKARGERSVGWTRENILGVDVDGSSAVVRDCRR